VDVGIVLVQFLHIAGRAAWFGGSLFANAVVLPYIGRQAAERRRELVGGLILGPERVMIAAALTAAVTGLVRGVAFGRIQSIDSLGTPYGLFWLASVLVAILVFGIGGRITSPAARVLRDDDGTSAAGSTEIAEAAFERVRRGFRFELAGITTILGLMVALTRL
jgi:uncharacterized membrane protein